MFDYLEKHLFLIIVAAFTLPMTFHTFIFPILKLKKTKRDSAKRNPRFLALVAAAGFSAGWLFLRFLSKDNHLLAFIGSLIFLCILLGLYLATLDNAIRFSVLGRTRINPERWIDTIDAPVALPTLVLFAGTLTGVLIHMLFIS